MNLSKEQILGVALIIGGALVGVVLFSLWRSYSADALTPWLVLGVLLLAFLLLVLPQIALGVYFLWLGDPANKRNDA